MRDHLARAIVDRVIKFLKYCYFSIYENKRIWKWWAGWLGIAADEINRGWLTTP